MSDPVTITLQVNADQAKSALDALGGQLDKTRAQGQSLGDRLSEGFSAVAEGVGGLVEAAQKAAEAVYKLAEAAAEHERTARALATLGTAYAQVQIATNDTVSAQQALAVQQSLVQSGLRVTGEQLAAITRRAREFALQTGGDSAQAIEQLTDALKGGEAEGLRRFGLTSDSTRSRVQNFTSAIEQMQLGMRGTAPAARTMSEELERTSRTWEDFKSSLAGSLSQALGLQQVFAQLTQALRDLSDVAADDRAQGRSPIARHLEALGEVASVIAGPLGLAAREGVQQVTQGRGLIGSSAIGQAARARLQQALSVTPTSSAPTSGGTAEPARVIDSPGQTRSGGGGATGDLRAQIADLEREAQAIGALFRAPLTGALNSQAALRARIQSLREAIEIQRDFAAVVSADHQRQEEEAQADRARASEVIATLQAEQAAKQAAREAELEGLARVAEAERALSEQRAQSLDLSQQFSQSFAQIADVSQTGAQALAKTATQAFGTFTGALRQHVRAVIEGKESIGEALRATLHETLTTLATEAVVQTIFQTASGLARLATGDYPGAASSFASAAAFGAVAALAGVGSAATSAPAQAASAQPRQIEPAARAGSSPGRSGGDGSTTIVYNIAGNIFGRERGEEEIAQYYRGAQQRGLVGG